MGFLDRLTGRKPAAPAPAPAASSSSSAPAALPAAPPPSAAPTPAPSASGSVVPLLAQAREKLDARDLPGALALYEQILAVGGDRADILVTISGDLGSTGHVEPIAELIAPRYDADRHGPATGLNLLQAYLATRNSTAAQHLLDILFALERPELEDRLHGFSNALAELIEAENRGETPPPTAGAPATPNAPEPARTISLVSISKPIWLYGLEPLADRILPPKPGSLRRIAFAQLATPGLADFPERISRPEDDIGRFSRALPLWLAETFAFCPFYAPIAAVGIVGGPKHYALFPAEWTTENLRQLVESASGGLDYVFTGAVQQSAGDTEVLLRVWEVKKFRERKQFRAKWSPATAAAELAKLHEAIRTFMEWRPFPGDQGLRYESPVTPAWLDVLGASLTLFLGTKDVLSEPHRTLPAGIAASAAELAGASEVGALAALTLAARARRLGLEAAPEPANWVSSPLVEAARALPA
jgi:hypothetical protein